jgi:DNA-binding IclR family transcriptional regulator
MAKTSYDVPAIRKGIRVIELLCDSHVPLGVTEIAQKLGLNTNMVFRLLRTLQDEGWIVEHDNGPKYVMSLKPFHHTAKLVKKMDIVVAAMNPLRELWEKTGETTYLGVLDVDRILCVEQLEGTGDIRVGGMPGRRSLMHCSAPGKAILAHATGNLVDRLAKEGLKKMTKNTICSKAALKKELSKVAGKGYALDREEYMDGLLCLGVPIFDHESKVAGAAGLSVFKLYYTLEELIERLAPLLIETGKKISQALGYPGGDE